MSHEIAISIKQCPTGEKIFGNATNKSQLFFYSISIQKPIFTTSGWTLMIQNGRDTSYGNLHDNLWYTKTGTPMNPVGEPRTVWRCCSKNTLTNNILGSGMIKYVVMKTILFVKKGSMIIFRSHEPITEPILFLCFFLFTIASKKKIQKFASVFEVTFLIYKITFLTTKKII